MAKGYNEELKHFKNIMRIEIAPNGGPWPVDVHYFHPKAIP